MALIMTTTAAFEAKKGLSFSPEISWNKESADCGVPNNT